MKIILITLLAWLLVLDASDQLELKCPKGWIIQGQVVYSTSTTDQTHHTRQTIVAICFFCRINSPALTNFGTVEMCVVKSSGFQKKVHHKKHKFCQYDNKQSEIIGKLNMSDICLRRYSSTYCGVNISKTTNISEALESIQFLPCDGAELSQIQRYSVDIQCPENWKVNEFKSQYKTYFFSYTYPSQNPQTEMCIFCKPIQFEQNELVVDNEGQINICSTTLSYWLTETFFGMSISEEKNIKVFEQTGLSNDDCSMSCGTRGRIEFSIYNTYFFNKETDCSEFDQNKFNNQGKIDYKSESDNCTEINFEKVKNSTSSVSFFFPFLPSFGTEENLLVHL
jgi:hypothetical protein